MNKRSFTLTNFAASKDAMIKFYMSICTYLKIDLNKKANKSFRFTKVNQLATFLLFSFFVSLPLLSIGQECPILDSEIIFHNNTCDYLKIYCYEKSGTGATVYMGRIYPGQKISVDPSAKIAEVYARNPSNEKIKSYWTNGCGLYADVYITGSKKPAGTACDDGNANTINDIIQANGCDCAGIFDACATKGGDSDNDGVCDKEDCQPNNPNLPAAPGTTCNDNNPNTINDIIQANGCDCAGIFDACATKGGDSDNDGVCDEEDCQPNNPSLPATPGTTCNDNNPNTENDEIQTDGCTCSGVVPQLASVGNQVFEDLNNNGIKEGNESGISGVEVKLQAPNGNILQTTITNGNGNYSFTDLESGSYKIMFGTPSSFNPSPRTGFNDNDVDNNSDNNPNNSNMTDVFFLSPGENNPTIDAGFFMATICDNLTFGGKIGFDAICAGSVEICGSGVGPTIESCELPSGGAGTIEYIWLKNEVSCNGPTGTVAQMLANPSAYNWKIVTNSNSPSLTTGTLTTSTCYLRCARRTGCDRYLGESNIVRIEVNPNCGENTGGTTTESCGNGTSITYGNGSIKMEGGAFY